MRSKAERLAVAGQIAPSLRAAQDRRVALVDAEGNVTGYTTLKEAQRQILERAKIELEVEGRRPERVVCRACGRLHKPKRRSGLLPTLCASCRNIQCTKCCRKTGSRLCRDCAGHTCACGKPISKRAVQCRQCQTARRAKPLCPSGHVKTGKRRDGKVYCKECLRERSRERRAH